MYVPNAKPVQFTPKIARQQKSRSKMRYSIGVGVGVIMIIVVVLLIVLLSSNRRTRSSDQQDGTHYSAPKYTANSYQSYSNYSTKTNTTPPLSSSSSSSSSSSPLPQSPEPNHDKDFVDPYPSGFLKVTKEDIDSINDGEAPHDLEAVLTIDLQPTQITAICETIPDDCNNFQIVSDNIIRKLGLINANIDRFNEKGVLTDENYYLYIRISQITLFSIIFDFVMEQYKRFEWIQILHEDTVKAKLIVLKSIVLKPAFHILSLLDKNLIDINSEVIEGVYQQKFTERKAKCVTFRTNTVQSNSLYKPKPKAGYVEKVTEVPDDYFAFKSPAALKYTIITSFGRLFLTLMKEDIDTSDMTNVLKRTAIEPLIKQARKDGLKDMLGQIKYHYEGVAIVLGTDETKTFSFEDSQDYIKSFLNVVYTLELMFG